MATALRRLLLGAACATFAAYSVSAQQISIHGVVKDTNGAAINDAHILVRHDRAGGFGSGNVDQNLVSDISGRFQVLVELGFYDICVMADAFTPQCRKVFVSRSVQLDRLFQLKVDPEVEKHIGDRF